MTEGPQKDSIYEKNGQLYARRQGKDLALFVFPLVKGGQSVAAGYDWSAYLLSFVKQYVPLQTVTDPPTIQGLTFSHQVRTGDQWFNYSQQTCNGYPLYYVDGVPQGAKTEQPALFQPATIAQLTNSTSAELESGGDEGGPTSFLGP
ncbi:hypothetical protein [Deinococcus actinosclerus]|uniref:Uncharacterized protein n=1 Tax=Deinococcus actinosclerus TaxID=1768108 RepID=A0ABM5X2T6_9DEIO|nr:hypothetical protein [Deinococcus actinosclerus]ALW88005.1 hypothetical protein AUC44_03070 [Deinococcus actinosclerus]